MKVFNDTDVFMNFKIFITSMGAAQCHRLIFDDSLMNLSFVAVVLGPSLLNSIMFSTQKPPSVTWPEPRRRRRKTTTTTTSTTTTWVKNAKKR
jgi:hypothetical protein